MHRFLLPLCLILFTFQTFSQVVSVDKSTGRMLANIPIWTVQQSEMTVPINLYYEHGGGVPVGASDDYVGLGWGLSGTSSITRNLRGFPDDYTGTSPDERKGWLAEYQTNTLVAKYITDLNLSGTANSNWTAIKTLYNSQDELVIDTEPDIFTIEAPGINAQFVFNENGIPQTLAYSDINIEVMKDGDGIITRFVVTNNTGTKFHFGQRVDVEKKTVDLDTGSDENFFKNEYDSYTDPITYTSQWMLTKIDSYYEGHIFFHYQEGLETTSVSDIEIYLRKNTSEEEYEEKGIYSIESTFKPVLLSSITTAYDHGNEHYVSFLSDNGRITNIDIYDVRRDNFLIKSFEFTYENVISTVTDGSNTYLTSVQEFSGCDFFPPYEFAYNNPENFPADESNSVDYWGYFNAANNDNLYPAIDVYPNEMAAKDRIQLASTITPSGKTKYTIAGADRKPNAATTSHGLLEKIFMPMGDNIQVTYEPNTYTDPFLGTVVEGAGVRVDKLDRFSKRLKVVINETIEYHYTSDINNYATGATSGVLSSKPQYAILSKDYVNGATTIDYATLNTSPYTEAEKWQYLTARTNQTLEGGSRVYYGNVIERKSGENGFVKTDFILPPNESSTDALWSDWNEISVGKAENTTSGCQVDGIIGSGVGVFPYIPASSSGTESALPQNEVLYDGSLIKLNESENTFGRKVIRTIVTQGLQLALVPNGCSQLEFLFGKYNLVHGVAFVADNTKNWTYEHDGTTNHSMLTTTTFTYGSSDHLYPTAIETTDAAGNKIKEELIYPQDYEIDSATVGTNAFAIEKMVADNRLTSPIERIRSQQLVGESSFSVIGASYNTYKVVEEKVVMADASGLRIGNPITTFTKSNSVTNALSPDSQYEQQVVFDTYDDNFRLTSSSNTISRRSSATVWSAENTGPALQLVDAAANEVYHTNFGNSNPNPSMVVAGGGAIPYGAGRNDDRSVEIDGISKLSGEFFKASDDYALSFWHNASGSHTIQLLLRDVSQGTVLATDSINIEGKDTWVFESFNFDLSGFTNEVYFTLLHTTGAGTVLIDDVAFFPVDASMVSRVYDFPFGVKSTTNLVAGTSGLQRYDKLGRRSATYDSRGNVRAITKYAYANLPPEEFKTYIATIGEVYENTATQFRAMEVCLDNVTYEWAFVDHDSIPDENDYEDLGRIATKTFSTTGVRDVYLRIKKTGYTTYETPVKTFEVLQNSLDVQVCTKGKLGYDLCDPGGTLTINCSSISGTPANDLEVIYKAVSISNGDGNYTYVWEKRGLGSQLESDWFVASTTSGEFAHCDQSNYEMRLTVTDGQNRTGQSVIFYINRYQSDPQCQVNWPICN